jgi:uncharacterized protein DUF4232
MNEPAKPKPTARTGWIIAIVIAVAAIALFMLVGRSSKPKPSTTPAATTSISPTPSSATSSTTPAALATCTTNQLTASVLPGNGAAGTEYYTLSLTNDSQQSCTITGYPGVSLVNAGGGQLGPAANRDTVSTASTLTLGLGQAGYATLALPNPGNYAAGTCSAASTGLKIYPPGQTTSLLTNFAAQACPGWTITALHSTQP